MTRDPLYVPATQTYASPAIPLGGPNVFPTRSKRTPGVAPAGVDLDLHQRHAPDEGHAHPVPPWILLTVFGTLLLLTVLTVAVRYIDLGPANIWLALGIAFVKAAIVALFFMHLWWDSPFNGLVLLFSLGFVVLFIGITIWDTSEYQPNLRVPDAFAGQAPASVSGQ